MPTTRAPRNFEVLSIRRRGFETTRSPASAGLSTAGLSVSVQDASQVEVGPLSWSAIVSGSAKGAAAGYIAPVAMSNGTTHTGGRIYQASGAGTIDLYFERVLGETGSIGVTVQTFASTNVTSGTHFTPVTQTVSFSDGQIGWQKVSIQILAIPTGFGLVGIQITGSATYHSYCYIWLQGTGYVSGAKFLNSLGTGVNSASNTSGDGSSGNPWRSPKYAAAQMGNSGGVLYVRSAGGDYRDQSVGPDQTGAFQFGNNCVPGSPLIVIADPANASVPLFDNGSDGSGYSAYSGIAFGAPGPDSIWLVGLHVTNGNITTQTTSTTNADDIVIWRCEVDNYKQLGSNTAGIRFDGMRRGIFQDCFIHNIYSREPGASNVFDSVPLGVHEGLQSFEAQNCAAVHCKFDVLEFGAFEKDASPVDSNSLDVSHCLFLRVKGPVSYQVQGAGEAPMRRALVRYNVYEGDALNSTQRATSSFVYGEKNEANAQSRYLDVYGNVSRQAHGFLFIRQIDQARYFNNVIEDSSDAQFLADNPASGVSQLQYADYNLYVSGTTQWRVRYNVAYNSMGAWRAINDPPWVVNAPDLNSSTTSTTPGYTNVAINDYRWQGPTGRGGRYIGVGNERVGIVNP
jgi:hypothetical protein